MIDRIFFAALTFCLLVAGTLAIGSAWFDRDHTIASAPPRVVQLERVTVVAKRLAPASAVAEAKAATRPGA